MPIDVERARALALPSFQVTIERGRLRAFAKSIGETDPVYLDVEHARSAGHPDLPVPPTFFFSLSLEAPDPFGYLRELGVEPSQILHGEQRFDYRRMAYAGDVVTLSERITDVVSKRNGAMELVTRTTEISRHGNLIATASGVLVVRNHGAMA
ncbi:MaoC family dehydratase N-terminal domain-containing protein [Amycolatopsis rubida]|uniref:N-terminal half of MaoC dehydratase n=1 Tax=Amycolatopsis rubida TaxID=112413 RepID=A0A1I5ZGV5_9PSEU|nr:MaoC family dehydratase N-terminal domain-containing protein [Amycolatopsis rubida]SFQ55675.1 N-terminal half of MaoC dehydratase [Amycolatopsis rubida]